jgi:hypothetical protein
LLEGNSRSSKIAFVIISLPERREDLKFGEPRNQMRQRRGRMAKVLLKRNAAARKGVLRFGGGVLPS